MNIQRYKTMRKPYSIKNLRQARRRQGATAVFLAAMLPVILAISAYTINVVYMELARTELQITMDVSTRAAGRTLAVTGDKQEAIVNAERLMKANPFANSKMTLNGSDVVFGASTRYAVDQRYQFQASNKPNAVQIKANGKVRVPMLFPTMGAPINFRPIKTTISTQTQIDVALVVDRSGSMAYGANESSGARAPAAAPPGWTFGGPVPPQARWLDLADAVRNFNDLIGNSFQEEHVSLSSYNESASIDVPLTSNLELIDTAMANYSAQFAGGATNIGDGILRGVDTLANKKVARSWASRVIIVLTDGNHNTGTDPVQAAKIAASYNISIYTITFSSEANLTKMEEVAKIGSGQHYHATTATQLREAFEKIAHSLPCLITY